MATDSCEDPRNNPSNHYSGDDPGRSLTAGEARVIQSVFGNRLATSGLTIVRIPGHGAQAFVGGQVGFSAQDYRDDFTAVGSGNIGLLLHEVTHQHQFQTGRCISTNHNYEYRGELAAGTPWDQLGPEQQAQMVEDYYRIYLSPNREHVSNLNPMMRRALAETVEGEFPQARLTREAMGRTLDSTKDIAISGKFFDVVDPEAQPLASSTGLPTRQLAGTTPALQNKLV